MKKISHSVYENLAPKQRVVACIEALARGDKSERLQLVRSCPKAKSTQNDTRFTEMIEDLMGMAMAVEADLRDMYS